jgi:hypothetical protein
VLKRGEESSLGGEESMWHKQEKKVVWVVKRVCGTDRRRK